MAEIRRLKQLQEENASLSSSWRTFSLDKQILQEVLSQKALRLVSKRELVQEYHEKYPVSVRRLYGLLGMQRPGFTYRNVAKDQTALRMRLRDLADYPSGSRLS